MILLSVATKILRFSITLEQISATRIIIGFPFIFAVKDKSKLQILTSFRKRISCDINIEFEEAKKQVKKIASLRLNEINKK